MSTISQGGLYGSLQAGATAIGAGSEQLQLAASEVSSATAPEAGPGVRVELSGGSLEEAMLELVTSRYSMAAGGVVVKAASEALQTVFEVFGPSVEP